MLYKDYGAYLSLIHLPARTNNATPTINAKIIAIHIFDRNGINLAMLKYAIIIAARRTSTMGILIAFITKQAHMCA